MIKFMKEVKEEVKTYHCIDEFNRDFFGEPFEKSPKQVVSDDDDYGKDLAVDLLTELMAKVTK